jgi:hypothetical protein
MQRIPLLLTALSLVPSCTTELASNTTEQHASKPYLAESRRCDPNFCILFTAEDSDHDGVADVDEIAAGTDPNDPLKYPTMIDLAKLMAAHQLPTFEKGASLMVLLPTRDANGLPLYGGDALLPARKSGLETAGIKTPAGIDISRGFTMSRTMLSNEMSFGQLFTAFGREKEGAIPVRLLADAVGWSPTGQWDISTQTVKGIDGVGQTYGSLTGTWNGQDINGTFSSGGGKDFFQVWNKDNSFRQTVEITKDSAGNITTKTVTTFGMTREGEAGTYKKWTTTTTTSEVSADKRHSATTTQSTTTEVLTNGTKIVRPEKPVTTVCDDGSCEVMPIDDKGTEVPDPDPVPDPQDPEYPDDPDDPGSAYAYIDPQAAESGGLVTANLDGMSTAIAKLGSTILVVQNDNNPLSNYEVPPTGIHDAWGPIALYGGDPDNTYSVVGGFGITPAFVRVPRPEYDPNLSEQKPPMDVPPEGPGCLYCAQPPAQF